MRSNGTKKCKLLTETEKCKIVKDIDKRETFTTTSHKRAIPKKCCFFLTKIYDEVERTRTTEKRQKMGSRTSEDLMPVP